MKKVMPLLLITLLLMLFSYHSLAQEADVTVPDVTGLNLPQAAALLNRNGLELGAQIPADNPGELPPNSIVTQEIAPGTTVPRGSVVNVTVVLPSNTRLIYDDNDLTLINLTDQPMDTSGLNFTALEGTPATYAASQWGNSLRERQCFQLWSVNRNGPKDVDPCATMQAWRISTNTGTHFWTGANSVTNFAVQENGIQRAVCNAAPPNSQDSPTTCEFYLAGGGAAAEITPFVYFAYTENAIALINTSDNLWMPTNQTTLYNYNPAISAPGAALTFGDPNLLREEFRVGFGNIAQLAPGQCLMYTVEGSNVTEPPEPCDVVAQRALGANIAFWIASFEVQSAIDGERRNCPAATVDQRTRCIVRR
jgi:hypothetical protein